MARLEALAAWFFNCLGIVLLAASILVVPANAFADGGSGCADSCSTDYTPGTSDYYTCLGQCCSSYCIKDTDYLGCDVTCCTDECAGDPYPSSCYDACKAQRSCNELFCNGGCDLQKPSTCGDRKNDATWCMKTQTGCDGCVCGEYPAYPKTCTCGLPKAG